MDDTVWNPSTFSKNRDRLLQGQIADAFFEAVLAQARERDLLSDEHFSVDGTLIQAWASHKSYVAKGEVSGPGGGGGSNADGNFRGQKRSNATHHSITDPDARLFRKARGHEAQLCYMGHVLLDNRHGLASKARATKASGTAERDVAVELLKAAVRGTRATIAGDKNYDTRNFVAQTRALGITPHVAQNAYRNRRSAIDARTTRHPGYQASQRKRKLTEQVFGWVKTVGTLRKTRHRGERQVDWTFTFSVAAYNLVRMGKSGGGDMTRRGCTGLLRAAGLAQRASMSFDRAAQQTRSRS